MEPAGAREIEEALEAPPLRFAWTPEGGEQIELDLTYCDIQHQLSGFGDELRNEPYRIALRTSHWWDVGENWSGVLRASYADSEILRFPGIVSAMEMEARTQRVVLLRRV